MPKIRTVLGDKDPAAMGHILPHEHTYVRLIAAEADHASAFDREQAIEEGAAMLKAVNAEQGISGLVDCAPHDLGRDMGLLVGLSRASGLGHRSLDWDFRGVGVSRLLGRPEWRRH